MRINETRLRQIIHEEIDEMNPGPEIEFARGQKHAARAIAAWLREVAETMNYNGDRASGVVETLAEAVEQGEWQS
jgi:hypothetical protein